VSQYATRAELAIYGPGTRTLADVPTADQDAHLVAASEEADEYLRRQYELPLSSWGKSLSKAVCWMATYSIMKNIGFNPEGEDRIYVQDYDKAIAYLEKVRDGQADIGGVDVTPQTDEGAPSVLSDENRGW
jgi:phage gp36-like protein